VDGVARVYAPDTDHRRVEVYSPQGASLGEIGGPDEPFVSTSPKQVAIAGSALPSLYLLGSDQIQRIDLDNTPPPPQQSGSGSDLLSVLAIGLIVAVLVLAVLSRRRRRRGLASVGAPFERPVELQAVDGAQRQQQQSQSDQDLLIANQSERKQ